MRTPEEIHGISGPYATPQDIIDAIRLAVREAVEEFQEILLDKDVNTCGDAMVILEDHFKKAGY